MFLFFISSIVTIYRQLHLKMKEKKMPAKQLQLAVKSITKVMTRVKAKKHIKRMECFCCAKLKEKGH